MRALKPGCARPWLQGSWQISIVVAIDGAPSYRATSLPLGLQPKTWHSLPPPVTGPLALSSAPWSLRQIILHPASLEKLSPKRFLMQPSRHTFLPHIHPLSKKPPAELVFSLEA